jgi:hypothetical protein
MKSRLIRTVLLAASVAAIPAVGSAAEHSTAMNSCVSAFMESLARHSAPLKLRESHLLGGDASPGIATTNASELILVATDAHDYHTVGRAICKFDANGQVTQIREVSSGSLLPL